MKIYTVENKRIVAVNEYDVEDNDYIYENGKKIVLNKKVIEINGLPFFEEDFSPSELEALREQEENNKILNLKEEKHAELKAIMQSKRNALTCEYDGDVFDCNEQAQSNMTSLMGFTNLGMSEFSIRSTNEHTHTFTSAQLVEIAMLMSKAVNDLYREYWGLKNALYECKSKEEIDAIRWE